LEFGGMGTILKEGRKSGRKEEIAAYLDVVLRANPKTFLEVQKMKYPTMEELLTEAGLIPEWIERGRAQNRLDIARKMKAINRPLTEITQITGLPPETIEELRVNEDAFALCK
jgi:predicted transposase YdaD